MRDDYLLRQPIKIITIKKIAVTAGPLPGFDITALVAYHDRSVKVKFPFIGKVKQQAGFGLATSAWCFQRLCNSKRVMWTIGNILYFTAN